MHGIVSLLDADHSRRVEEVWAVLEERLDLRGMSVMPFPHVSYQVAEHYDADLLEPILQSFATTTAPFDVVTTGLGIFTEGLHPLLYINVARNSRLNAMHAALWPQAAPVSAGIVGYYHPENWVPHITLSHGDLTRENMTDAMRLLDTWDFTWQLHIDNLALLYTDSDPKQDVVYYRFPLSGKQGLEP
jgi:2'-5' RNA ligase